MRSTVHTNLPNMKGKKEMIVCAEYCRARNLKEKELKRLAKQEIIHDTTTQRTET